MLEALVKGLDGNGQPSAFDIAQLARGHARKKLDQLRSALEGHQMRNSHRILIMHAMRHMAFLAEEIDALDRDIATLIREANLLEAYELL
jgi:transposase